MSLKLLHYITYVTLLRALDQINTTLINKLISWNKVITY